MPTVFSLAVVGADYPNKRGPGRRFEIQLCEPGEPVQLVPDHRNPVDPTAVAVFSARNIQRGYLTAERCGWIRRLIVSGRLTCSIFQERARYGAIIRVALDNATCSLPDPSPPPPQRGDEFWTDDIPPDD